jgi:uncharacterized RDD family membrane protein YckC
VSREEDRVERRQLRELQRERHRQRDEPSQPQPEQPLSHQPAYGTRIVAGAIDIVAACVPLLALFFAVADSAPAGTIGLGGSLDITIGSTEHYLTGGQGILFVGMILAVWVLVFGLMPAVFGGTLGMLAMGLQVVGVDGGPIPFGRHITRTALWVVDGFPYVLPGAMAFFCMLATPSRRRVGDLVARTAVVRARSTAEVSDAAVSRAPTSRAS